MVNDYREYAGFIVSSTIKSDINGLVKQMTMDNFINVKNGEKSSITYQLWNDMIEGKRYLNLASKGTPVEELIFIPKIKVSEILKGKKYKLVFLKEKQRYIVRKGK